MIILQALGMIPRCCSVFLQMDTYAHHAGVKGRDVVDR